MLDNVQNTASTTQQALMCALLAQVQANVNAVNAHIAKLQNNSFITQHSTVITQQNAQHNVYAVNALLSLGNANALLVQALQAMQYCN
jgi:hypothetical protein